MNIYHCMIELRSGTKALGFAAAAEAWMGHLKDSGTIRDWRLMRRKFGLASARHTDFILEVEVAGLAELEEAFRRLGENGHDSDRRYDQLHQMIGEVSIGLYRPYPDPAQRERIALI